MVKLKIKDLRSLNEMTRALHKNGYNFSTFITWKNDNDGKKVIDYFTIYLEVERNE